MTLWFTVSWLYERACIETVRCLEILPGVWEGLNVKIKCTDKHTGIPDNAPDDAGTDTHEEVKVFGSTSKWMNNIIINHDHIIIIISSKLLTWSGYQVKWDTLSTLAMIEQRWKQHKTTIYCLLYLSLFLRMLIASLNCHNHFLARWGWKAVFAVSDQPTVRFWVRSYDWRHSQTFMPSCTFHAAYTKWQYPIPVLPFNYSVE